MNVRVVARTRWRLVLRALAPSAGRARTALARNAVTVVAAAFIPVVLWFGFAGVFDLMRSEGAGAHEAALALALAFNGALVVLLVSDLHAAVATLLTDPDLDLLRRAPMSPRQVLFLKLADALPQTAGGLLLIVVPAALAYHAIYSLPVWAWALFAVLLACLWAIPLALGTAAALWALGRVPGRRVREALGAITAFMLFAVWLGSVVMSLGRSGDPIALENMRDALRHIPALYRHGPASWAAHALAAAADGNAGAALANAGWLVLAAAGALALAIQVAARKLETVQSRLRGAGTPRRAASRGARVSAPPRVATSAPARSGPLPVTRVVRALAARDARLFLRDWPVLSDVVIAAILWSLLPVLWSSMFGERAVTLARAMFLALAVGLGNEIAGRAVPIERHGLAWTRLAPLPPALWIAGKLAVAGGANLLILAVAGAIAIPALGLSWWSGLGALASALPALALATVLGLWSGATFGRADWNNPRGMLTHGGRLIGALVMVVQVALWWGWAAAFELHYLVAVETIAWGLPAVALLMSALVLAALARKVRAGLPA